MVTETLRFQIIFVTLRQKKNINIMKIKIPFRDRNQMTMKEKIANPLSIDEAVEFSEEIRKGIIHITDY